MIKASHICNSLAKNIGDSTTLYIKATKTKRGASFDPNSFSETVIRRSGVIKLGTVSNDPTIYLEGGDYRWEGAQKDDGVDVDFTPVQYTIVNEVISWAATRNPDITIDWEGKGPRV